MQEPDLARYTNQHTAALYHEIAQYYAHPASEESIRHRFSKKQKTYLNRSSSDGLEHTDLMPSFTNREYQHVHDPDTS